MNTVQEFINQLSSRINIQWKDGHPFFKAKHVAHILGYDTIQDMLEKLSANDMYLPLSISKYFGDIPFLTEQEFYHALIIRAEQLPPISALPDDLWLDRPFELALYIRTFYEYAMSAAAAGRTNGYIDGQEYLAKNEMRKLNHRLMDMQITVSEIVDEQDANLAEMANGIYNIYPDAFVSTILSFIRQYGGYISGMENLKTDKLDEISREVETIVPHVQNKAHDFLSENDWKDSKSWASVSYSAFESISEN